MLMFIREIRNYVDEVWHCEVLDIKQVIWEIKLC